MQFTHLRGACVEPSAYQKTLILPPFSLLALAPLTIMFVALWHFWWREEDDYLALPPLVFLNILSKRNYFELGRGLIGSVKGE